MVGQEGSYDDQTHRWNMMFYAIFSRGIMFHGAGLVPVRAGLAALFEPDVVAE